MLFFEPASGAGVNDRKCNASHQKVQGGGQEHGVLENDAGEPEQHGEGEAVHDLPHEPAQRLFIILLFLPSVHHVAACDEKGTFPHGKNGSKNHETCHHGDGYRNRCIHKLVK